MTRGPRSDASSVLSLVRGVVHDAALKSDADGEIVLALPKEDVGRFAALFDLLERHKERLDVLNFGLAVTTMEDVFLK